MGKLGIIRGKTNLYTQSQLLLKSKDRALFTENHLIKMGL